MTIKREFATVIAVLATLCASAGLTPRQKELLGHSLVHRGDGKGRPDNTMEALLYTWGRGYTPESDIRFSKDGVVLAFHDNTYEGKKVGEYTWDEIRKWDVGSYRGAQYDTCRPPTWDAIFMSMKGQPERRIHIDYKDVPPERVAEMVKSYGLEKQCYFICKDHALLKRYKAALPNGLAMQWMNLGNWKRIDFDKPGETEKCEKHLLDIFEKSAAENFKDLDMVQLHCQVRKVDGKLVFCPKPETMKACLARLNAAGVEATMCVWQEEANDPEVYKYLFRLGFTGFGTDYPEALYKAIEELDKEVVSGGMI